NIDNEENSEICIPYNRNGGYARKKIILYNKEWTELCSTLSEFDHLPEVYQLHTSMIADREQMLEKNMCEVVIRNQLTIHGVLTSIKELLRNASLDVNIETSTNVPVNRTFGNLEMSDTTDCVVKFLIPSEATRINLTFKAKIRKIDESTEDVVKTESYAINTINSTNQIICFHLLPWKYLKTGGNWLMPWKKEKNTAHYRIFVTGKNGEKLVGQKCTVELYHYLYPSSLSYSCETDEQGYIDLRDMNGVTSVAISSSLSANGGGGDGSAHWSLRTENCLFSTTYHIKENDSLDIPYFTYRNTYNKSDEQDMKYLLMDKNYSCHFGNCVRYKDNYFKIAGLKRGEYVLRADADALTCNIIVAGSSKAREQDGEEEEEKKKKKEEKEGKADVNTCAEFESGKDRFCIDEDVCYQLSDNTSLQITQIDEKKRRVYLSGVKYGGKWTKVHLWATHFIPGFSPYNQLKKIGTRTSDLTKYTTNPSMYCRTRTISEEYRLTKKKKKKKKKKGGKIFFCCNILKKKKNQKKLDRYVLERANALQFIGNNLQKPSLLIRPFSEKSTRTETQTAKGGGHIEQKVYADNVTAQRGGLHFAQAGDQVSDGGAPVLEFLGNFPGVGVYNLKCQESGESKEGEWFVEIPKEIGNDNHNVWTIVAVDDRYFSTQMYICSNKNKDKYKYRDCRLNPGLNPSKHFIEKREIELLRDSKKDKVVIEDFKTSQAEVFESIEHIFVLYKNITKNTALDEWTFLYEWETIDLAAKLKKWNQYMSHEFNFFMYWKDRSFFETYIKPLIKSKVHKTFFDYWFLGDTKELEKYTSLGYFKKLNALEQILLSFAFKNKQGKKFVDHFTDKQKGIKVDPLQLKKLFETALADRNFAEDIIDTYDGDNAVTVLSFVQTHGYTLLFLQKKKIKQCPYIHIYIYNPFAVFVIICTDRAVIGGCPHNITTPMQEMMAEDMAFMQADVAQDWHNEEEEKACDDEDEMYECEKEEIQLETAVLSRSAAAAPASARAPARKAMAAMPAMAMAMPQKQMLGMMQSKEMKSKEMHFDEAQLSLSVEQDFASGVNNCNNPLFMFICFFRLHIHIHTYEWQQEDKKEIVFGKRKPPPPDDGKDDGYFDRDLRYRAIGPKLFEELENTKEFQETQYYKLGYDKDTVSLIPWNHFWCDLALHLLADDFSSRKPFVSQHFAVPTSCPTEMLLALAVLDLPLQSRSDNVARDKNFETMQMVCYY
ncbi:hypothetical protein RFI_15081, partial [Reticulomyxa filosa]